MIVIIIKMVLVVRLVRWCGDVMRINSVMVPITDCDCDNYQDGVGGETGTLVSSPALKLIVNGTISGITDK